MTLCSLDSAAVGAENNNQVSEKGEAASSCQVLIPQRLGLDFSLFQKKMTLPIHEGTQTNLLDTITDVWLD